MEQDKRDIVEGLAGGRMVEAQKVCSTWKIESTVQSLKPGKGEIRKTVRKKKTGRELPKIDRA